MKLIKSSNSFRIVKIPIGSIITALEYEPYENRWATSFLMKPTEPIKIKNGKMIISGYITFRSVLAQDPIEKHLNDIEKQLTSLWDLLAMQHKTHAEIPLHEIGYVIVYDKIPLKYKKNNIIKAFK